MSEMVDRVAKAIWEASSPVLRDTDSLAMQLYPMLWVAVDTKTKDEFMAMARAAIEALQHDRSCLC